MKNDKDIGDQFFEIGKSMQKLPFGKGIAKLAPPKSYNAEFVTALLTGQQKLDSTFGKKYRNSQAGHDEILATSAVRNLIKGLLAAGPLSKAKAKKMAQLFETASQIRVPTKFAGYSLRKKKKMQHPTANPGGLFANSKETMSAHSMNDRARRSVAADAMEGATKQKGTTATDVMSVGLQRVLRFSLNTFIAPVMASNVSPYANKSANIGNEHKQQIFAREGLKAVEAVLEVPTAKKLAPPPSTRGRKSLKKKSATKAATQNTSPSRRWDQIEDPVKAAERSPSPPRTLSSTKGLSSVLKPK